MIARIVAALSPRGRLSRTRFWIAYGVQSALVMALVAADTLVFDDDGLGPRGLGGLAMKAGLALATAACAYAGLVLGIRRLHDRGRSGWWSLLAVVPVVGGALHLAQIGLPRGEAGANRYGSGRRAMRGGHDATSPRSPPPPAVSLDG